MSRSLSQRWSWRVEGGGLGVEGGREGAHGRGKERGRGRPGRGETQVDGAEARRLTGSGKLGTRVGCV